jgi:hypothetical protein
MCATPAVACSASATSRSAGCSIWPEYRRLLNVHLGEALAAQLMAAQNQAAGATRRTE